MKYLKYVSVKITFDKTTRLKLIIYSRLAILQVKIIILNKTIE